MNIISKRKVVLSDMFLYKYYFKRAEKGAEGLADSQYIELDYGFGLGLECVTRPVVCVSW